MVLLVLQRMSQSESPFGSAGARSGAADGGTQGTKKLTNVLKNEQNLLT